MNKSTDFSPIIVGEAENYQKLYKEEAAKFWDLQKIQQTAEEKEFEDLCHKLEGMSSKYRNEIDSTASINQQLQEEYNKIPNQKKTLENLKAEEEVLTRILANYK